MAGAAEDRPFDLIAMGRAAVDLYGEQVGGRLEDMATFAKYLGGCAANIAVGSARLGLKVAMLTRVGNEHMGRFVRETLAAEGIDVGHVVTDPQRLTGLVVLGIRDRHTFPLIFFRENCADMAMSAEDFDAAFIASAHALLVIGTHFSTREMDATCRAAIALARKAGTKVVFDVDYRPVLWGLTGHGGGEQRFVASDRVSAHLQSIVPECDLVVGTEEEIHIAGGTTDTLVALQRLREFTKATLVLKRGSEGCAIFPGKIPENIDDAIVHRGFPTDVFNVLGAGDGFMAGLLSGWLRGKDWPQAARIANACGSLVVSRHGCAPAMPSAQELSSFLDRATSLQRPHDDPQIIHLHRLTTGHRDPKRVFALAFDHHQHFAELADGNNGGPERVRRFKTLMAEMLAAMPAARSGAIIDDRYGGDALSRLTGTGRWLSRPVEKAGSRPLEFEAGRDLPAVLRSWPVEHVIKCLVAYRADDAEELRVRQDEALITLQHGVFASGHRWLLEVIPPDFKTDSGLVARAIEHLYQVGVRPAWWKLPPVLEPEVWNAIAAIIRRHDPWCRGALVLGLDRPEQELFAAFEAAIRSGIGVGFAVGRSVWRQPAEEWFAGRYNDDTAMAEIAARYAAMVDNWVRLDR